jgi:hypothetical protein
MTTEKERAAFVKKEREFTDLVAKVRTQCVSSNFMCENILFQHAKLQREWDKSRPTRSDEIHATRDRMLTSYVFLKIVGISFRRRCILHCSVIARLKSHGWEDELQHLGNERLLLQIPCLNTARDITDRSMSHRCLLGTVLTNVISLDEHQTRPYAIYGRSQNSPP